MIRRIGLIGLALVACLPASAQLIRSEAGPPSTVCIVVTAVDGRLACVPALTMVGGGSIDAKQIAVGTSATLVVPARSGRQRAILTPTSSVVYYVGGSNVSVSTGTYVPAGGSITLDTSAAIYAAGAAAFTLSYVELF